MQYRILKKGEIIQAGDEYDNCRPPWIGAIWVRSGNIGKSVPDISIMRYRRRVDDDNQPVCDELAEKDKEIERLREEIARLQPLANRWVFVRNNLSQMHSLTQDEVDQQMQEHIDASE